jgi:hypothetical protein
MVPDTRGICYSRLPCAEREKGIMSMQAIEKWWTDNVHKPKPKKDCLSIKDIFKELAK